jgi:hypothetical protein
MEECLEKEQRKQYAREYYLKNRQKLIENSRQYRMNNRKKCNDYQKKWERDNPNRTGMLKRKCDYQKQRNKKIREKFIEMYGGKCSCCGESDVIFLTMDHINNDGNKRRGKYGCNNLKEYSLAIKEYRPDMFQVLCYNCNHAKHLNGGECPHKLKS